MAYFRGTVHSRNPSTGVKRLSGDVFEGPEGKKTSLVMAKRSVPELCEILESEASKLEHEWRDAVSFEFCWSAGELEVENTRVLEREPAAAVKIAVSLVTEGLLSQTEALLMVSPSLLASLLAPLFSPTEIGRAVRSGRMILEGKGLGTGVACGLVALDSENAHRLHREGHPVILVCDRLSYQTRDCLPFLGGFVLKEGPAQAALLFEKPGVITEWEGLNNGEEISLDSASGKIYRGRLGVLPAAVSHDLSLLLSWADEARTMELRANVTTPEEVALAGPFGANGVGLCRIESLFQQPARLPLFSRVLSEVCELGLEDSEALSELESEIGADVEALFEAAQQPSMPFILRLLDVPVAQMLRFWKQAGFVEPDYFEGRLGDWMQELNPLGGLRFGRLSMIYPALLRLQVRAILSAWKDRKVRLQLMMPGVSHARELEILAQEVERTCREFQMAPPMLGSMLETPRACLTIEELLERGEFFSFGTGDLTESTCGLSRYDAPVSFLPHLMEHGVYDNDPFEVLDRSGVGRLIEQTFQRAKQKCPDVELGTCGAQAVEESSMEFCCRVGLDYASVPVHHLPAARLAAARAAIRSSPDHHPGS